MVPIHNDGRPHKRNAATVDRRATEKTFASIEHLNPEAVAAFVDGELSAVASHRARVHMVHCRECRADVAEQRRAAETLRSCRQDDVRIPESLMERLTSLEHCCPAGPGIEGNAFAPPATLLDKMDLLYRTMIRLRGK